MSAVTPEAAPTRRALPLPDLSIIDEAIHIGPVALARATRRVRPADLGRDLARRPPEDARAILDAMDARRGSAMLRAAHPSVAARLLGDIACERAVHLLAFIPTDHEIAILAKLDPAARDRIDHAYTPERKVMVDRLLAHQVSAVGRLMTPKFWACDCRRTAGEAMNDLRHLADEIEIAVNCYITDAGRLVGVVPLRIVSTVDRDTRLEQIMTPEPMAVGEDTERSIAAEIIDTHDFQSLPVVDRDGMLVGALTVGDVLEAAFDRVGTAILNQGAISGTLVDRTPYFLTPLIHTVRSRISWLVLLFVAETATGTVLRYFEGELAKVVALSFFVPLLIGTGGNAGSQTVSTIIRALALGEVRTSDVVRVVRREISAGLLLGILLGSIAFVRALLWGVDYELATCVAVTILVVCTWANAVGATIPLVAQRFGIDPTVVSAPLITTLVDASGLFIYFSIAHLMISQLHG